MSHQSEKVINTLCVIHDDTRILLGRKKRGFGVGTWNGFGGKIEGDTSIEEAVFREVKEECGLVLKRIEKRGILNFISPKRAEIEGHIFKAVEYEGEPTESEEMLPRWFTLDEIPYDEMWADDQYWLPLLLAGKSFKGTVYFDENDRILRHDIAESSL